MADKALVICEDCGWYRDNYCKHICAREAGKRADALAQSIAIPSTKLGYGNERLTFELRDGMHMTIAVCYDGCFSVERLWVLGRFSAEDVKELVEAIAKTKIGSGGAAPIEEP